MPVRSRRHHAVALGVVALAGSLLVSAIPAQAATQPATTSSRIGLFSPDWDASARNRSDAGWADAARTHAVMVGMAAVYGPHVAALHQANPQLTVLVYNLGPYVARGSADYSDLLAHHPDYFARDSRNRLITVPDFPANTLLDIGNAGARSYMASRAVSSMAPYGFDGVYIDCMGVGPMQGYTSAVPVNRTTHRAYTVTEWLNAGVLTLNAVKSAAGSHFVMWNGLKNGSEYAADTHILAGSHADGGMAELFLRGATSPASQYPSVSEFTASLAAIRDMDAHGKSFFAWTKVWSSATTAQVTAWDTYALATYLLARGAHSYYNFLPSRTWDRGRVYSSLEQANLGSPLGAYTVSGGTYTRTFQHGVVSVNPTTHAASIRVTG